MTFAIRTTIKGIAGNDPYKHCGTSFVEVYQNCNVFNDGVWDYMKDKSVKANNSVFLEHGQPLVFGENSEKALRLNGLAPEIVDANADNLWIHDETIDDPTPAFLLSRMRVPVFPEPLGVFRAVERTTYDQQLNAQITDAASDKGTGDLDKLLHSGDTWTVE